MAGSATGDAQSGGTQDVGAQSGASQATDSATGTGTGTGAGTDTGSGQSTPPDPTSSSTDDRVDRSDFDRVRNQLSAADKRRQDLEKQVQELTDKEKSELQRATERAESAETELKKTRDELQRIRIERQLLADSEYGATRWHDAEDILARLHRAVADGSITLDEQGAPDPGQFKKFLKDTADKRKYLLRPVDGAGANGTGPSGTAVGVGDKRGGQDKTAREADLKQRYRIR